MTECNQCGDCCTQCTVGWAPDAPQSWLDARSPYEHPEDWVASGVNVAEALAQWHGSQGMRDVASFLIENWVHLRANVDGTHVYRCKLHDDEVGCTIHATRPDVCRGYPWYGNPPRRDVITSINCSFHADVREDLRPDGWVALTAVEIRERRGRATSD